MKDIYLSDLAGKLRGKSFSIGQGVQIGAFKAAIFATKTQRELLAFGPFSYVIGIYRAEPDKFADISRNQFCYVRDNMSSQLPKSWIGSACWLSATVLLATPEQFDSYRSRITGHTSGRFPWGHFEIISLLDVHNNRLAYQTAKGVTPIWQITRNQAHEMFVKTLEEALLRQNET